MLRSCSSLAFDNAVATLVVKPTRGAIVDVREAAREGLAGRTSTLDLVEGISLLGVAMAGMSE